MPFINRLGNGSTRQFGFETGVRPGAPTSVAGVGGFEQVTVSFSPPNALGTGTPTYTVTSSPGGFTASGSGSPLVVTGLTNGTSYTFTVTASNSFGSSTSDPSSSVTAGAVPSQPAAPSVTVGESQIGLSWTAPANNGFAITDYGIQFSSDNGSTWTTFSDGVSTSTSATVTGLTNGTSYKFRINATNSIGASAWSEASVSITPATTPTTPVAPTATRGDGSASLTWTAPANGGSAITDYTIQYSSNSGSSWTTFVDGVSSSTSATVTGLTNGTSYTFRIAAVNSRGSSSYSAASSAVTPAGVPSAPAAPTPTAGNAQVSLSWTAPASNGSAITDYSIYYATSASGTYTLFTDTVSTTTSVTVTGLSNGTAYYFKVAAVNAVGTGDLSAASVASTPVAPPCFATCTPSCGTLSLSSTTLGGGSCRVPAPAPGCGANGRCWDRDFYSYPSPTASCTDACGTVRTVSCTSPYPTGVDSTVASSCCSSC